MDKKIFFKYLGGRGVGLHYEKEIPKRTVIKSNHNYKVQILKLLYSK